MPTATPQHYTYNGNGDLTVVQDPLHNLTTMTYTANGRVQTVTDANNHTTTYQYDSQDRLTTVGESPTARPKSLRYNSQGNVIKVTDERNNSHNIHLRRYQPRNRARPMPWAT